ncbi:MAG: YqgE/AlgH family protein [Coraliomargaritaceae bacterium]
MRFTSHRSDMGLSKTSLAAGVLLLAHPTMEDPRFRRSVILLSAHAEEGSLGVVLNHPTGRTLGQIDAGMKDSVLASTPLYTGGPVGAKQIILAAWKWTELDSSFQLYFGIDGEKARKLQEDRPEFGLRGFLGHAGWSEGQLEAECEQGAWLVVPLSQLIDSIEGDALWLRLIGEVSPEMRLLADEPDDPSTN